MKNQGSKYCHYCGSERIACQRKEKGFSVWGCYNCRQTWFVYKEKGRVLEIHTSKGK